jgi:hypothetical protein
MANGRLSATPSRDPSTGKSFDRKIPRSSMTVKQLIAGLDELVEAVRQTRRQDQGRDLRTLLGLYARRALCRVLPKEGRGLRRQRTDWRLADGRVVTPAVTKNQTARISAVPLETQTEFSPGACERVIRRSSRARLPITAETAE